MNFLFKSPIVIIVLMFVITSCKKNDLSNNTDILSFTASDINRTGPWLDTIFIDNEYHVISLMFSDSVSEDSLPVTFTADYTLAPGASCNMASGSVVTVTIKDGEAVFTVTAESGVKADFYVILRDNQLPDSDFEDWYTAKGMDGISYQELGLSETSTVWATANKGTSIYGKYGTVPFIVGDNTLVSITTGETSSIPITAGTVYSGRFDLNGAINNPTDPRKASVIGVPFILKPSAMKFKYSYVPGPNYIKATPKNSNNIFGGFDVENIPGSDTVSIYAILELRAGTNITEIARAEFYSGTVQSTLTEVMIPFIYTSSAIPTHISVLMTSSKSGHLYTGAIGSNLKMDDFELMYE